jgi:hypothetical protein
MILALSRGFVKQIYKFTGPVSRSCMICLPMGCGKTVSDWLDLSTLVTAVALTFTGIAADGILVFIYTLFQR